MARPDIKDGRREQILDAFETCVARYGIEGATLAKVAETAKLARPLIRHNIGNREALIEALVERFLKKSQSEMNKLVELLPNNDRVTTMIDWLFDPAYTDARQVQVAGSLIVASDGDPKLAEKMRTWLNDFLRRVEEELIRCYPNASTKNIAAVAAGISGIYFNIEALYPLKDIAAISKASKQAALILVFSLEGDQ